MAPAVAAPLPIVVRAITVTATPPADQSAPIVTRHARQRAAERRVPADRIGLIAEHGRRVHAAGAVHCFWGRREAQRYRGRLGPDGDRLNGAVVVLSADGTVLTTYRNKGALKHLRRKADRAGRARS